MVRARATSAHERLLAYTLLVILLSKQIVLGEQIVKYLPGFDGELPFKLVTGYVSVDDSELFYYFVESEGDPENDPLLLWLSGGPGCTSFSALVNQFGPLEYVTEDYDGGLPRLRYSPHARTKTISALFLDSPVGTGYSYSRTREGWASSDTKAAQQSYHFLRKWLIRHPKYLSNQVYVGGDSYSGITVPLVTKNIVDGNRGKAVPHINLKGYMVGCPGTNEVTKNAKVKYAHNMALISDDIYESARRSCNGNYTDVDPGNKECKAALAAVFRCLKDINEDHILKPDCEPRWFRYRRSLRASVRKFRVSSPRVTTPWCKIIGLTDGNTWGDDERVKDALHVRKGTKPVWKRCNGTILYHSDVTNVVPVHKELSRLNLKLLVESGDHDMVIPYTSTLDWIKSLNLPIVEEWRPWYVDDQVAGYTMKYGEGGFRLSFASVKGGGHPASYYKRKECNDLFGRWVRDRPI